MVRPEILHAKEFPGGADSPEVGTTHLQTAGVDSLPEGQQGTGRPPF